LPLVSLRRCPPCSPPPRLGLHSRAGIDLGSVGASAHCGRISLRGETTPRDPPAESCQQQGACRCCCFPLCLFTAALGVTSPQLVVPAETVHPTGPVLNPSFVRPTMPAPRPHHSRFRTRFATLCCRTGLSVIPFFGLPHSAGLVYTLRPTTLAL